MLSKLLSNINAGKTTSGEDTVTGSGNNKEGGMSSSAQVFKSLLQSLQNEGSSGKAKQQLLALSGSSSDQKESTKGENVSKNILGGSFTAMGEGTIENVDQNILKELQKEFQNIKNEFTGDESDTSSEGEEKVKTEQAAGNVSDENTDNASSDAQQSQESVVDANVNSNDNSEKAQSARGRTENVEGNQKGQIPENGDLRKAESEKKSLRKEQNSKGNFKKKAAGNLEGAKKENIESGSKGVETRVDGASENMKEADGESSKNKEQSESTVNSKKSELSQGKKQRAQKPTSSFDMKGTVQNGSVEKIQNKQVSTKEVVESKEKPAQKDRVETRKGSINNQGKLFKKAQSLDGRQVQSERMREPKDGQSLKNQNMSSASSQAGVQIDGGQTAKTELTEQQKKVMGSLFQKNSVSNISTKGLEMKSLQNQKGKNNAREKSETKNSQRGLGKQSSEGRNKLLSRLGISSANAQKQTKSLDMQSFSGVSVGESNSSLEEQKVSWEEQVTKMMDASSEKESKASSGSSSVRLGQMPITNVSLRKKILPGLTQRIQKAAPSAKENGGNWQKHNFTLDDGKNIQLSVRESKGGVLQVKMGSMNLDLSKLLQQNLQQIREHLRQEFGSDIDLQFENQQQGEESQFSEDTESSDRKRNYRKNFAGESLAAENTEEVRTKTVRNFGYNQMEWTA